MNIVLVVGHRNGNAYGVIDTPCYPARFYAGLIRNGWPARNDSYFRTLAEAQVAAMKAHTQSKEAA